MRSTSPRHARPARAGPGQATPGRATGAPDAEEGVARPRRRRRGLLPLIGAPVIAMLVAVGLVGMHVVTWPVYVTADTSQQDAAKSIVNALSAPLGWGHSWATTRASASPSASPRHRAAKPSASPSHHPAVKAAASTPASPGRPARPPAPGVTAPPRPAAWPAGG